MFFSEPSPCCPPFLSVREKQAYRVQVPTARRATLTPSLVTWTNLAATLNMLVSLSQTLKQMNGQGYTSQIRLDNFLHNAGIDYIIFTRMLCQRISLHLQILLLNLTHVNVKMEVQINYHWCKKFNLFEESLLMMMNNIMGYYRETPILLKHAQNNHIM